MSGNEVLELGDEFFALLLHPKRLDGDLPQPSEPTHSE